MRVSTVAAALVAPFGTVWSLIAPPTVLSHRRHAPRPSFGFGSVELPRWRDEGLRSAVLRKEEDAAAAPPDDGTESGTTREGGNSAEEKMAAELARGVTLDGGPVIDFASVKDAGSRAERALAAARRRRDDAGAERGPRPDAGGRLTGVNDEVVATVGREIGAFADEYADGTAGETADAAVQACARRVRARAGPGTFPEVADDDGGAATAADATAAARLDALLERAYEESGLVTEAFAKTFYLGTTVLPAPAMRAIWAVYVWCRRTDEIVDAPRPDAVDAEAEMLADLAAWEARLERLFARGEVVDVLDLPLLDCKVRYPNLPLAPFADMIRGMLMDIPGLGQERYETWDELHLYCYRVAGTVGLMSMPVFGCAPGYTDEMAKEPALSLGVALQITNILRDVGEDAETRGRVYLPQRDMAKFGVTEQQLFGKIVDENYINLMKYEIARARMYYARALRGVAMLRPESRLPVQLSLDAYGKILDKIEENGYDTLTQRAYVGKWEKLAGLPSSWYRTLDFAQTLPLPEDWGRPAHDDYERQLAEMLEKKWEEQSQ